MSTQQTGDATYPNAHRFLHDAEANEVVELVYDSSYGGEQTVHGVVKDDHDSLVTTVEELGTDDRYVVWNGVGVEGRETGDVKKETPDGASRKIGEFVRADLRYRYECADCGQTALMPVDEETVVSDCVCDSQVTFERAEVDA